MRLALLAALILMAVTPAAAQDYGLTVIPHGGAAGGPALYLPDGDLLNVRNVQGGVIGDTNLDLGAGSTADPGDIVLNFDVGRRVLLFDGHKHLVASFGDVIRFYRPVIGCPRTRWSWLRLNRDNLQPKH